MSLWKSDKCFDFQQWRIEGGGGAQQARAPPPLKLDQLGVFNPIFYQNALK